MYIFPVIVGSYGWLKGLQWISVSLVGSFPSSILYLLWISGYPYSGAVKPQSSIKMQGTIDMATAYSREGRITECLAMLHMGWWLSLIVI